MNDFVSAMLPPAMFYVAFMVTMWLLCRGNGITKLKDMVAIFLAAPVTLKTWGLFLAAPTICLLLNSMLIKVGNDASWPKSDAVALARIAFYNHATIGLEILLSIIMGSFGAVAFKGQGPGGTSFEMKQDPVTGVTTSAAASGPAVPPAAVPPVDKG